MAKSFRDLIVWNKAMGMVEAAYLIVGALPRVERYRLGDQIARASISVAANIAEGCGRGSTRDYARFLSMARGSLAETETLLLLTARLGYVRDAELTPLLDLATEIGKMLTALQRHLRNQTT
jgi:four helix bundle protein